MIIFKPPQIESLSLQTFIKEQFFVKQNTAFDSVSFNQTQKQPHIILTSLTMLLNIIIILLRMSLQTTRKNCITVSGVAIV